MAKRKPSTPNSEAAADPSGTNYTVLARRYRPQQFADLVGQEHVAQALSNALQSGRVAHAYLFTGSRGVGKTSTARILAKALNCEKGPTITPCDECEICLSITAGDDVDVLEIDGASNNGVDQVRELRQNVQFRPARARFKIYIIDEVHMLSSAAFNALLKTLEEPPDHVKFIFATTEIQKIPITILSRCQRFDFAGINTQRIAEQLKRIVAGEGMEADDEALHLIARRAGGSMRDGESLLDQLLAFGQKRLTVDQVHSLLGTAHDDRVIALAGAVLQEDARKALALLAAAAEEGLALGEVLDQLIEYWRDLMVVHCAGLDDQIVSVGKTHRETLQEQAKTGSLDSLLAGLDILVGAKNKLTRGSQHGRVLIEMALVRLSRLGHLVSLSQLAQWLKNPQDAPTPSAPASNASSRPTPAGNAQSLAGRAAEVSKKNGEPEATTGAATAKLDLTEETLPQIWSALLAQFPRLMGAQIKKNCNVAISGPNTLVIQIPAQYNLAREDQLQNPERVAWIEKTLGDITGRSCQVRIESITQTNHESTSGQVNASPFVPRPRERELRGLEIPLVGKIVDVLDAQIVKEDPGFGESPAELSDAAAELQE